MFELDVQCEFCAAHAIVIAGRREPIHGHNWRVTVTVSRETLDGDGLVCDFHEVERALQATVAPWHNANLNQAGEFAHLNPTAEHVAMVIAQRVQAALGSAARVSAVRVTEAPGCAAIYRPR